MKGSWIHPPQPGSLSLAAWGSPSAHLTLCTSADVFVADLSQGRLLCRQVVESAAPPGCEWRVQGLRGVHCLGPVFLGVQCLPGLVFTCSGPWPCLPHPPKSRLLPASPCHWAVLSRSSQTFPSSWPCLTSNLTLKGPGQPPLSTGHAHSKEPAPSPPIPSRPRPVPFQLLPVSFLSPPTKVTPIRPRPLRPPRPSSLLAIPSLSSPGTWPCPLQASSPCTGPLLTRLVVVVDSDQGGLQELRLQHPVNTKAQHCVFLMGELERTESCLSRPGPLTVGH